MINIFCINEHVFLLFSVKKFNLKGSKEQNKVKKVVSKRHIGRTLYPITFFVKRNHFGQH